MRKVRGLIGLGLALLLVACAHTPKQAYTVAHDPVMDQNGGVVLIADVCVQKDVVGDEDYFSIAEAKEGAKALLASARSYLQQKQVQVRTELIPFVCGSLAYGNSNTSFKVADRVGGEIKRARPPFAVDPGIKDDPELVDALAKVSADAFQRSTLRRVNDQAKQTRKAGSQPPPVAVSPEELAAASRLIAEKMNASSVIYLGVNGTSISTGKAVGQGILSAAVGMATGVATGLATGGMVSVMYFPGYTVDWRYMSCGLVNLDAGQCSWSGWASAPGDPMKPKVVGESKLLETMLHDLVHKPVPSGSLAEK